MESESYLIQSHIIGEIIYAVLWIFFLTGAFLAWFFIHRAKTKERLLLIEKGFDPSQLSAAGSFKFRFAWLKTGIVTTGASLGFIAGASLSSKFELMIVSMFLFGGIGMILAHVIDKPKQEQ